MKSHRSQAVFHTESEKFIQHSGNGPIFLLTPKILEGEADDTRGRGIASGRVPAVERGLPLEPPNQGTSLNSVGKGLSPTRSPFDTPPQL